MRTVSTASVSSAPSILQWSTARPARPVVAREVPAMPPRSGTTLGQFTLVRLERDTQLLVPVYDYCVPQSECDCGSQEDPCGLFRSVAFPMNEFFPPNAVETPCDYNSTKSYCACH